MANLIIGISGVAGSGKDTFFKIFKSLMSQKRISVKRLSLANALKKEVSPWTEEHYGINATTCSREEKEIIRPFLVFHGTQKRNKTNGRHWVQKLSKTAKKLSQDNIVVITDVRYDDYDRDEAHWLQEELGGVLVHLSMSKEKKLIPPANKEEARNDPKLIIKSNYKIEWKYYEGSLDYIIKKLSPQVENFIKSLLEDGRLPASKESEGRKL
jgi:hypothetical protein